MPSRDLNHRTVAAVFERTPFCEVFDTSSCGDGAIDFVVGYAGSERLIEVKADGDDRPKAQRRRLSLQCGRCGKSYQRHKKAGGVLRSKGDVICEGFERKYVEVSRSGEKPKAHQKKWHLRWPGHEVEVCRNELDAERVLEAMLAESVAKTSLRIGDRRADEGGTHEARQAVPE